MNTRKLIAHCLLLLASAVFLLASCDEGVETDLAAQRGMPLPQGKYPLRFTAIKEGNAVQTRVTESADDPKSTLWTAGTDEIGVSIGTDGAAGQYTITATDGSSMTEEQPVYWQNTNPATIYGWYPATTDGLPKAPDGSIDLDNQSDYLKFDFMKAESTKQYQYDSKDISLPFKHQMAKMNITLRSTDNLDLDGATVAIYGYTTCTFDKGTVTPGTSKGYLTACCTDAGKHVYRAMVVPIEQNELGGNFIKVTLKNDKVYYYKSGRKLEKNMLYSYTVDVREILSPGDADAMNDIKGTVTIRGDGKQTNNPVTITDHATVTLKDVDIKVTTTGEVNTTVIRVTKDKQLTLKVEGNNNRLEAVSGGGIVLEDGASIVVDGDGINQSKLVVKAGKNTSQQLIHNIYMRASTVGIGAACGTTCGNIEIKNVKLEVSGADTGFGRGAAIGTSGTPSTGSTVCGNITITGAHVTAIGGSGAAAIGTGFSYTETTTEKVGDITISGSTIVATVNPFTLQSKDNYGACIGLSLLFGVVTNTCGTITITCDNEAAFLNNLKYNKGSDTPNLGYKIGKGASHSGGTGTIGAGSTFNGTPFTDGSYGSW